MYIINFSLLLLSTIYIYSTFNFFRYRNKNTSEILLFLTYAFISVLVLMSTKDLYYFYLMYKLLNICIYMLLISFSTNPINFRYLIYYYFIRFVASLLFIISLYDLTNNNLSTCLINISVLIKLSIYPFSDIISNIYKNMSFRAYLVLNYIINYLYIVVLFYMNATNNKHNLMFNNLTVLLSLLILIYASYNFNKQYELKGAVAYSSIVNLPIIITPFFLLSYVSKETSIENIALLITYIRFYLFIYSNNILIINLYSFFLEPTAGKT